MTDTPEDARAAAERVIAADKERRKYVGPTFHPMKHMDFERAAKECALPLAQAIIALLAERAALEAERDDYRGRINNIIRAYEAARVIDNELATQLVCLAHGRAALVKL